MINGREGSGKTTICLQIAKEILQKKDKGIIIWLATEGSVRNTLIKMVEIGIDRERFIIPKKDDGFLFDFVKQTDRDTLKTFLDSVEPPIIAVFIDSLRGATRLDDNDSRLGKYMHKINAIVCENHMAALIYIHHFNKSLDREHDLDRSAGSTAITAAVRLVLSVKYKTKFIKTITLTKSNIDDSLPELESLKNENQISIYDPKEKQVETEGDRAERFLISLYANRSKIPAKEMEDERKKHKISEGTLRKAKEKLGVKSDKEGIGWIWVWHMCDS